MIKVKYWLAIFICLTIVFVIVGTIITGGFNLNLRESMLSSVEDIGWAFFGVVVTLWYMVRTKVIKYSDKFHWFDSSPNSFIRDSKNEL